MTKAPTKASAKSPSQRMLRVGEQLRHALVSIIQRGDIDDDTLSGHIVTISEVRMSPDLKIATAFVSAMGDAETAHVVTALGRHAKFLRGRLGPELRQMKFMPIVRFRADTAFENFAKIDRLLHSDVVRRDVEGGSDDGEGGAV
jgi:ribosome-binding factor A